MFTRVKYETIQARYMSMYLTSSGIYTQPPVRLKPQIQNLGLRDQIFIFTSHDCPSERENFNFVHDVMMMDDCSQRILINRINKSYL